MRSICLIAFLVTGVALAAVSVLPDYIEAPYRKPIQSWLAPHSGYRLAIPEDCDCAEDIESVQLGGGAWQPQPNYQPYFAHGDFDGDSVEDAASDQSMVRLADIQELVNKEGARAAVDKIYGRSQSWELLLKHIGSGSTEWIQLGVVLRKEADGAAGNLLAESLGEALEHAPKFLLTLASRNELDIRDFCRGPDVDDARYSSYDTNLQGLHKRVAAVETITARELVPFKTLCLQSLAAEEKEIARYFEMPESQDSATK